MTHITHLIPNLDSPMKLREGKLRRDLDIVRRARTDGTDNLPASAETELSEAEHEVVTACERAHDDLQQWLLRRLRIAAEAADHAEPTPDEQDFEGPLEDARLAIGKLRVDSREHMIATRLQERRRHRERAGFRRDNRLDHRSADYPEVPLLAIGVVALVAAIETWLNARVFAEASDFGLLGGALMAILVSLPNVLIGLLVIGLFGLRHMLHVRWGWRLAGTAAVLLGTAIILFHNIYFANWRALLAANPDARLFDAWRQLQGDPSAFLAEKDAWVLFLVGLVAAMIAAWDGFHLLTDRYPGYARVDRRYETVRQAYDGARRSYRDKVHSLIADCIAVIDRRITAIEGRFKKVSEAINRAHVDVRTAEQAAQENARICARVLKTYRGENRRVRTTPAPAYFAVAPRLDAGTGELPAFDLESKRGRLHERIERTRTAAREAKGELRRMAEAEIEGMLALVETIETEVDRRAQKDADDAAAYAPQRLAKNRMAAE